MISTADLQGESVVVRDARPPPAQAWTSDEGAKILSRIRREIISHIQLRHRNVLAILGIASSDEYPLSIVTPLAVNGNALSYLKRSKSSHRTDVMLKIVHDTTLALEYLHGLLPPIIHGDVHAQNILIDAEGRALLCDFGLSRIKHDQTRTSTNIVEGGRDRYLAPELFLSLGSDDFRTTPESDCYAFGMTILELATLERPFAEYKHDRAIYNVVVGGLRPKRPPIAAFGMLDSQAVDLVWSLLGEMWCQEPAKRLSMSVVLRRVVELSTHHSSSTSSSPAAASQRTIAQSLPSPLSSLSPTQVSQIAVVTGSISPTQHSKHAPLSPLHGVRIPQDRYGEGWGSALLHALDALEKFGRLPLETQELLPIAQVC
ncbi:kinase-like protein [Clavulina sp. PMI_390]|nr:kinase-like protein [Clavulina sp. PMI_390]